MKPVSGALDIVSKTSQGIEAASSNHQQGQDERTRPPRAFYGKDKIIRKFDMIHSNLLIIAPMLRYRLPGVPHETQQLNLNCFVDAWIIDDSAYFDRFDWRILMTTENELIRV